MQSPVHVGDCIVPHALVDTTRNEQFSSPVAISRRFIKFIGAGVIVLAVLKEQ